MNEDKRFYGIYEAQCTHNTDPDNAYKITVKIPQVLGDAEVIAKPCLPVTSNANHPDHVNHLASEVAALLVNHSLNVTSGTASSGTAHTHNVSATLSHTGNTGTLSHPHAHSTDILDTNTATPQHTYHRSVPNIGQKVWVMFIAGDPNFPVWMGVEL